VEVVVKRAADPRAADGLALRLGRQAQHRPSEVDTLCVPVAPRLRQPPQVHVQQRALHLCLSVPLEGHNLDPPAEAHADIAVEQPQQHALHARLDLDFGRDDRLPLLNRSRG